MSDKKKVLILERCTKGCGYCEWIMGSPRCTHEEMETRYPNDEDLCMYQKVPSDSRLFHPDCPLPDYKELNDNTVKYCMVCSSTDRVKRYETKTHAGLILNSGDGYVEYCKKHAIEHGYWVD